jgi:RNA polymerase sigma factor (sigma-70 family)
LFGIARRQAHNTLRRRGVLLTGESSLDGLPADGPQPEASLLAGIERDELARAVGPLASVHREILFLIFVQELTYGESANVLVVPIGTVKSRLSNAKRALRVLLSADKETEK